MEQDKIFLDYEGNNWFKRNHAKFDEKNKFDWVDYLLSGLEKSIKINSVIELGCSNGWRLNQLSQKFIQAKFYGIDASKDAIKNGKKKYSHLILEQSLLSNVPFQKNFDIVIVNFVLHWISRQNLAKCVAEIDRVTKDDGLLILGDFLPDFPQKRHYHHCSDQEVYTYKQDYAKIFMSLGIYSEIIRINFNHDEYSSDFAFTESAHRGVVVLMKKSLKKFYPIM